MKRPLDALLGLMALSLVGLAWHSARRQAGPPGAAPADATPTAAVRSPAALAGAGAQVPVVPTAVPEVRPRSIVEEESIAGLDAAGEGATSPPAPGVKGTGPTVAAAATPAPVATSEPEISHFPGVTVRFAPGEPDSAPDDPPVGEVQEIVTPSGHRLLRVRADERAAVGIRPPPAR